MPRLLFVTTRNIYSVSGEYRLINNRALVLKEHFGIDTDFYAFVSEKKKSRQAAKLCSDVVDFTFFGGNPIDFIRQWKCFENKVVTALCGGDYTAVVISGALPFNLAKAVKRAKDVHLVYDSHGAWEELVEYSVEYSGNLVRRAKYALFSYNEKQALRHADSAFAVTDALNAHLFKKYGWQGETHIVPCALKQKQYTVEDAVRLRRKWRDELSVGDNEVLFVYSGGISPWQSLDGAYAVYKKYLSERGNAKLLIMTPEIRGLSYDGAIIRSFSPEEVGEVLFAGDVALLLREECLTNRVAFPNKYLEYVQSGMLILSTPYISDISAEIQREELGWLIESADAFSSSECDRLLFSRPPFESEYAKRQSITKRHSFEITLEPFVKMLNSRTEEI